MFHKLVIACLVAVVCELSLSLEDVPEFMPSIDLSLDFDISIAEVSNLHPIVCSHSTRLEQPALICKTSSSLQHINFFCLDLSEAQHCCFLATNIACSQCLRCCLALPAHMEST